MLEPFTSILYEALSSPFGLLLRSPDQARARQFFYRARRDTKDPELHRLEFRLLNDNLIAITKTPQ